MMIHFLKIKEFPKASYCYLNEKLNVKIKKYWDLNYKPKKISLKEAIKKIKTLLENSIKMRLRSDVPIAFSLSGGVDSNVLAGFAKKN